MIIKLQPRIPKPARTEWHPWFAWHPVIFERRWEYHDTGGSERAFVWLRTIQRKGTPREMFDGASDMPITVWTWEYAL